MIPLQQFLSDAIATRLLQADVVLRTPLSALGNSTPAGVDLGTKPLHTTDTDGGWSRSLGVRANARLGIATIPADHLAALALAPEAGLSFLALSADASVGVDVAGRYPAGAFAIAGSIATSTDCSLQWIFAQPDAMRLADALAGDVAALQDPLSLDALFAMRGTPGWRQARLEVDGAVDASLGLKAGLQAGGTVMSVGGGNQVPVGLTLGLSGSASLRLAGRLHLSATRDPRGLRIRLSRDDSDASKFGLQIGATADISASLTDAASALASTLPDPAAWLPQLQPLLEPQSYLPDLLGTWIDARYPAGSENLLARVALGLTPGQAASATALQRIGSAIASELQTGAATLAQQLTTLFQGILPAQINAGNDAAAMLASTVNGWVADHADVPALATRLSASAARSGLPATLDQLGVFGTHLQARLGAALPVDAEWVAGLRAAIATYGAWRAKWIAALTQAAQQKLGLVFGARYATDKDNDALLDIVFVQGTPAARALYAAMARGRLDDLQGRLQAARADIADVSGRLTERLERAAGTSLSLQLLGTGLAWNAGTAATLSLTTTLAGDLTAVDTADGTASAEAKTANWFGHFDTALACVFAARSAPDGSPANTIGFRGAYSFAGDGLSRDRLAKVIEAMAPLCDVPPWPALAARLGLPEASSATLPAAMSNLDLVLPLDLASADIDRVRLSTHTFADVANIVMAVADQAYPNVLSQPLSQTILETAADSGGLEATLTWAAQQTDTGEIVQKFIGGGTGSGADPRYSAARMIRHVGRLCVGLAKLRGELAALKAVDVATLRNAPAQRQAVMDHLTVIAAALKPAAVSGLDEHGQTYWLPWRLTAFARALAALADRPVTGGFVPVARIVTGDQARTFVLGKF